MRYAYGVATALLVGGAAFSLSTGQAGAQVAANDATALVLRGGPISYKDLRVRISILAAWLAKSVPQAGARVASRSPDTGNGAVCAV